MGKVSDPEATTEACPGPRKPLEQELKHKTALQSYSCSPGEGDSGMNHHTPQNQKSQEMGEQAPLELTQQDNLKENVSMFKTKTGNKNEKL